MLTNGLRRRGPSPPSNGDELQSVQANGRKRATSVLSLNKHLWASLGSEDVA